jgi:peptide/nickel transport system substrate-binding protein
MQTTYRIHQNVTWHDGPGLTAKDFVLAHEMTLDPEVPVSQRSVSTRISRIDTPDNFTLVIEWKTTYPFANAITEYDLGPFPTHILGEMYRATKEAIPNSLYWTREFIGVGPYRLAEWQPGTHLVLKAYDKFFRGRAKVDTLVLKIIEDPSTVVANLLAGTVDGAGSALDFAGALTVKKEWERAGKQLTFITQSANYRRLGVQFRVPHPPDILDVRVRRGLMHAIDRESLVNVLFDGVAFHAETFIPPDDLKFDWVKDAIVRYEFDERRARELLTEAGWRQVPAGTWTNKAGEPFTLGLWASGSGVVNEVSVVQDAWKRLSLDVDLKVLTPAENRDDRFRVSYPAFSLATFPATFQFTTLLLQSSACPSEETRWRGNNRGCFQNAENDRLIDAVSVAIEPDEQRRLHRDLARLQSELLPELPLFFLVRTIVFREGVTGIKGPGKQGGGLGWNAPEWDVVR